MAKDNRTIGRFHLDGIPPAMRGTPQIEVTFDIDANGILHVAAINKATGKEQKRSIKASSGLSEEEIKHMVKDAEAHASEDKKFHELVEARNRADNLVHATSKSLKELGDKVSTNDKTAIEAAIEDLKQTIRSDDQAEIEAKTQTLAELSGKIAQQVYSQAGAGGNEGFTESAQSAAEKSKPTKNQADVVDAEFEEVKEGKK
jgi:molecular chaperone DnaK